MSNSKTEARLWGADLAGTAVAQTLVAVRKDSAVSQVSKSAAGGHSSRQPTWKSAIQQVWKPALRIGIFLVLATLLGGCASKVPKTSNKTGSVPEATPAPAPAAPASAQPPAQDILPAGAAKLPAPFEGEGWESMFSGQSLAGWRVTEFAGRGEVECRSGVILLNMGDPFTGINWTNDFPKMDYEIALDAMRVMGSDFFCGLTVPVGEEFCSLIVGGWGGSVFGISSVDGMDASENETTKFMNFEQGRWYRIRLRVMEGRIQAWVDQEKLIDLATRERKLSVRAGDIEMSKPVGLAAWQTTGAMREIKVRRLSPAEARKGK